MGRRLPRTRASGCRQGAETAQAAISLVQGLPGWGYTGDPRAIAGISSPACFSPDPSFAVIRTRPNLREMLHRAALCLIVVGYTLV